MSGLYTHGISVKIATAHEHIKQCIKSC
uniref:Uncharacterized protein n=1 Tax=Rhizophora mucronata TaxID=61149 RepID=A0A2P2N5F7_RHIMU